MAFPSESSTNSAPLERLRRIKDIAASRKEERGNTNVTAVAVGLNGKRQRKTSAVGYTGARYGTGAKQIEYHPGTSNGPSQSKESQEFNQDFGDEIEYRPKFEGIGLGEERLNRVAAARKARFEEGTKFHVNKQDPKEKPRWNCGTSTRSKPFQVAKEDEPLIKTLISRNNACILGTRARKDRSGSLKRNQLNEKTSDNLQGSSQTKQKIPTVKSSIPLDETKHVDPDFIKRFRSDPILSLKKTIPSTKFHRERCTVLQPQLSADRPDTPYDPQAPKTYVTRRARKKMEVLHLMPAKHIDEAAETRQIFKESMDSMEDNLRKMKLKKDDSQSLNSSQHVSRIPVLSRTYTVIHNTTNACDPADSNSKYSRYFQDQCGQRKVIMKTITEDHERENKSPSPQTKPSKKWYKFKK